MDRSTFFAKIVLVVISFLLLYQLSLSLTSKRDFWYFYQPFLVAAFYLLILVLVFRAGNLVRVLTNIKDTSTLSLLVFIYTGIPILYAHAAEIIPLYGSWFSIISLNIFLSLLVVSLFYLLHITGHSFAKIVFVLAVNIILIINFLYVGILNATGFEFGPAVILHAGEKAIDLAIKEHFVIIITTVLMIALLTFVFYKYWVAKIRFNSGLITTSVCLVAFSAYGLHIDSVSDFTARKSVPSYSLYEAIAVYNSAGHTRSMEFLSSLNFLDSEKEILLQHGIVDNWRVSEPIAPEKKHNVIVIYLESLQSDFTKYGGWKGKSIVPNLDSLSGKFTTFSNYYNSSTPTINAIISSQCGINIDYVKYDESGKRSSEVADDSNEKVVDLYKNKLVCLSDMLRSSGYTQVFMKGADMDYTNKRGFFSDHGYNELLGFDELYNEDKHKDGLNNWGLSDVDLFEEALIKLDELERKEPFNLTVLTVNSHQPGYEDDRCPQYEAGNQLLNGVHCSDYALGKFLKALFKRKILESTYVFIVGDHTLLNNPNNIEKSENRFTVSWYGKTYFSVYSPNNELPEDIATIGYTPDFAATLLDVLGYKKAGFVNGKSLVSERKRYQHLVAPSYEIKDGEMRPSQDVPRLNECSYDDVNSAIIRSSEGSYSECERARIYAAQLKLLYTGAL